MNNSLAIVLALLIIGFFALDHFVLHLNAPMLALDAVVSLTKKMAFWR